jgi:glycine cleavage system H protein
VHVELPEKGRKVEKGASCTVVESVKSAFDIYAPVSGTIVEVNDNLNSSPELINSSPYADGFLFAIQADNAAELNELLSPENYAKEIGE